MDKESSTTHPRREPPSAVASELIAGSPPSYNEAVFNCQVSVSSPALPQYSEISLHKCVVGMQPRCASPPPAYHPSWEIIKEPVSDDISSCSPSMISLLHNCSVICAITCFIFPVLILSIPAYCFTSKAKDALKSGEKKLAVQYSKIACCFHVASLMLVALTVLSVISLAVLIATDLVNLNHLNLHGVRLNL